MKAEKDSNRAAELDNLLDEHYRLLPNTSATFGQQLMLYIKYLFKLRWRQNQTITLHILSIILLIVYMSFDAGSLSQIKADKTPEITNLQNGTVSLASIRTIIKGGLRWAPDNEYTRKFANKYSFGSNVSFYNSIEALAGVVNENQNDIQIGFSLDKVDENGEYNIRTLSTGFSTLTTIVDAFISESLMREKKPSMEYNISVTSFSHPTLDNEVDTSALTSFYIYIAFMFIIVGFGFGFLLQRKNRIMLLMELCSMRDSVMVLGEFIVALVEGLVLDFISTGMICFYAKLTKGSNFLLVFIHILLLYIGIYWFFFMCMMFIQSEAGGGVMLFVNYVISFAMVFIFMWRDAMPKWILTLCMVLFPNSPSHAFFSTISLIHTYYGPLSFSNAGHSFDFSVGLCYGLQFVNIVIYVIITSIVILCKHREWGYAPLGWRGLFKINKWKKMLGIINREQSFSQTSIAIRIADLDKTYTTGEKPIHALKSINAEIKEGETIALIGPNGCGKSTLFNAMTGSILVDSGSIDLYGEDVLEDISLMYKSLGFVAQDNIMIDVFSVEENLVFFSKIKGIPDNVINESMNFFISQLILEEGRNTRAKDLSGGMKRKLCCAIALMQRPSVLILDEPTAGVDAQSRQIIWKTLDGFAQTTTLISCHSLEEAETVASRIFVMKSGEISFAGSPAELREATHCGYMITVSEGTCTNETLLKCIQEVIPEARIKENAVLVPIDQRVADAVMLVQTKKSELGIDKFTVHVENLEGNLIKYVLNE